MIDPDALEEDATTFLDLEPLLNPRGGSQQAPPKGPGLLASAIDRYDEVARSMIQNLGR